MQEIDQAVHLAYLEAAPIAVIMVDASGRIGWVNRRTEQVFGYAGAELIDREMEVLLPERFRSRHHLHRNDYFHTPRTRPMGLEMELAGLRKDGSEFPVEVGLSHTRIGHQEVALAFITDITVRVEAAQALRRHAVELEQRVAERTAEIERRREVAEGLHEILTILNTARPLEAILDSIVARAHQLLQTDAVAIYRHDEPGSEQGHSSTQPISAAPSGASALRPEPIPPDSYRSVLAVPLNVKGEVYGSVCLYYRAARSFRREERELAVAFADQAALAIENSRLREQVQQNAVAAERNRLARDLHDAVTQTLFSTSLIAEVLPILWHRNPDEGRRRLDELRQLTRGALAEMRTLLLELRPAALLQTDLDELLQQLAAAVTGRARIPVSVSIENTASENAAAENSVDENLVAEGSDEGEAATGPPPLTDETKIAFYRIAQEALNNVVKHARADSVAITLHHDADSVSLTVLDDGRGFDPDQTGGDRLGLQIMRERAEAVGARLTIDAAVGRGARIHVVQPHACATPNAP